MKKKIDITPNIETLFGTRDENLHVLEDGLNIGIDLKRATRIDRLRQERPGRRGSRSQRRAR